MATINSSLLEYKAGVGPIRPPGQVDGATCVQQDFTKKLAHGHPGKSPSVRFFAIKQR
jgi:hypothetical protein